MDMIEVDGLRIVYERAGEGPPLVLLHGYVGDGPATWRGQIDENSQSAERDVPTSPRVSRDRDDDLFRPSEADTGPEKEVVMPPERHHELPACSRPPPAQRQPRESLDAAAKDHRASAPLMTSAPEPELSPASRRSRASGT
jgi:hypothetical protein